MLGFRRSSFNGVQKLFSIYGFRQLVLYSTSTSSISTEVNPNFINYLVQNLGFSKQQALSTFSKFTLTRSVLSINNAESSITFLEKIGLQQSQIRNVVVSNPRILSSKVEKTLIPKIEGLQKLGFSKDNIVEIVNGKPTILSTSLENAIIPAIQIMREILGCEAHVIHLLKNSRDYNLSDVAKYLQPNVDILRSHGISIDSIRKILLKKPHFLFQKTDRFKDVMINVKEKFGNCSQFLAAAIILSTLSKNNIESKMQIFKSFGWTDSHITALVSLNPWILGYSGDGIKKKLDFLMNEVGFEPNYLVSKCSLFTCSLEKRIAPRHKLLLALKEKGLIKENFALYTTLTLTESQFIKKFVLPFKEVHEIYSKFAGINSEALTLGLSKPNSSAL